MSQRGTRVLMMVAMVAVAFAAGLPECLTADEPARRDANTAINVSAKVDALLAESVKQAGGELAPLINDEDFLRRVSFDLAGTAPTPAEVTLFALDPDPGKRAALIERLLKSDDYAQNWGRYWRDVVFSRATNMRALFASKSFTDWMTEQLSENRSWDKIAADIVTATGDVQENGATGLIFAHEADASEVASEVSRIFLGIQIQCANCHDHPTDQWKREQFHELAAFFPRMRLQPKRDGQRIIGFELASVNVTRGGRANGAGFLDDPSRAFRFLDRNRDGKLSKTEVARSPLSRVFDRLLQQGDTDKDKMISLNELKAMPKPPQQYRGQSEHYMPNLDDPGSRGDLMEPVFFVNGEKSKSGIDDLGRRELLSKVFTAKDNPWFARAIVNRMWSELLGRGFYQPIDDMGPERTAVNPEVLDVLARGFVASDHDLHWLFRTITLTRAYQRSLARSDDAAAPAEFACATPTRLRSDQLFTAITNVFGVKEQAPRGNDRGGFYNRGRSQRDGFNQLFGFDPSTPQDDLTNTIPQALFLMNSTQINGLIRATATSRLGRLLQANTDDTDAVEELYLMVLSRSATDGEQAICKEHIQTSDTRAEAYEDLLWSLINSSEFLSKR